MGISARFVLFDSWYACDKVISQILAIGYGVICRLKANKTHYHYKGKPMTLSQLWHTVARHELHWVSSRQIKAAQLKVELPLAGEVSIVFVRWSKKNWHAFLCTEAEMEIAEILNYYSRRWAIECYFRDCKQLLGLGKGQSETFDAVVARASIVAIRCLILIYILAKRQLTGPIGPLFRILPVSISNWLSFNLSGLESGRFSCCRASSFPPILTRMSSSIYLTYLKIRSPAPLWRSVRKFSQEDRCALTLGNLTKNVRMAIGR